MADFAREQNDKWGSKIFERKEELEKLKRRADKEKNDEAFTLCVRALGYLTTAQQMIGSFYRGSKDKRQPTSSEALVDTMEEVRRTLIVVQSMLPESEDVSP